MYTLDFPPRLVAYMFCARLQVRTFRTVNAVQQNDDREGNDAIEIYKMNEMISYNI